MNARLARRTEWIAERGASALLAAAVGYASLELLKGTEGLAVEAGCSVLGGMISYLLCIRVLKRTGARSEHVISVFNVREIETMSDELVLTEVHRLGNELVLSESDRLDQELILTEDDRVRPAEALILDDILTEMGPESRVVRLFDRKAMPTPGQLKSRIDSHLDQGAQSRASADAAQALSDALAELRRSLR